MYSVKLETHISYPFWNYRVICDCVLNCTTRAASGSGSQPTPAGTRASPRGMVAQTQTGGFAPCHVTADSHSTDSGADPDIRAAPRRAGSTKPAALPSDPRSGREVSGVAGPPPSQWPVSEWHRAAGSDDRGQHAALWAATGLGCRRDVAMSGCWVCDSRSS